jgi:hypothetical protein
MTLTLTVSERRPWCLVLTLCCAVGLGVLAGTASSSSELATVQATPDVTVLIPKATRRVRAKPGFSGAVLLEADGLPAKGKTKTAAGITRWRFVFNNQGTRRARYDSAFLFYRDGRFGRFVRKRGAFLEDRNISKAPRMTLATAVSRLRAARHRAAFLTVTLRSPLGRTVTPPLYIFGFGSQARFSFVSVNSKTGQVRPIS